MWTSSSRFSRSISAMEFMGDIIGAVALVVTASITSWFAYRERRYRRKLESMERRYGRAIKEINSFWLLEKLYAIHLADLEGAVNRVRSRFSGSGGIGAAEKAEKPGSGFTGDLSHLPRRVRKLYPPAERCGLCGEAGQQCGAFKTAGFKYVVRQATGATVTVPINLIESDAAKSAQSSCLLPVADP